MSEYLLSPVSLLDMPGTLAADDATAATLVFDHMRHYGDLHEALARHLLGELYDWVQPVDFPMPPAAQLLAVARRLQVTNPRGP